MPLNETSLELFSRKTRERHAAFLDFLLKRKKIESKLSRREKSKLSLDFELEYYSKK
jgi:hypothetical protein